MVNGMGNTVNIWPQRKLTTFTRMVMLVGLYFLGGLLGKQGTFLSGSVVLVWPPAGIALAAILLFGYRFWPGVALGFAASNAKTVGSTIKAPNANAMGVPPVVPGMGTVAMVTIVPAGAAVATGAVRNGAIVPTDIWLMLVTLLLRL